jgi:hypothetical protein
LRRPDLRLRTIERAGIDHHSVHSPCQVGWRAKRTRGAASTAGIQDEQEGNRISLPDLAGMAGVHLEASVLHLVPVSPVLTLPSTILMFQSIRYINRNGPLSEHRRAEEADSPINRVEAESMPNHPLAQAARANRSAANGGNARRSNSLNRNSLNRRSANPAMTATAGPPLSYSARRGLS